MKIAIHKSKIGFSHHWLTYCEDKKIPYKIVNCYENDIIKQLADIDILMWHFHQNNPKDILISHQVLFSLQQSGKIVFPDFNTSWHFDDKVGQKYLLEALDVPIVPSYVFLDKQHALDWINSTKFPKVFKLRGGAGSQNVKLVQSKKAAVALTKKAFGTGFPSYDAKGSFKERLRKYKIDKTDSVDLLKGLLRFFLPPLYSYVRGRERGYIYFQDFIPNNDNDIRVVVIGNRAFAIKRMVRKNDFRASGSGHILYDHNLIPTSIIQLAFEASSKLKTQCIAFDFIMNKQQPLLVEISYGFSPEGYTECQGFWDKELNWHQVKFNPYGWMIELAISSINSNHQI